MNVWPPTLILAERDPPVLAATANATEPLPLPLVPDVMVSHPALLFAVQLQPVPADTEMLPDPPETAIELFVGLML